MCVVIAAGAVIVVVDDDDSLRDAMQRLLEAAGFCPEVYSSAEALLAAGVRDDAACIVTDLKLPGMTGLDLVATLRASLVSVPVVVITAHDARGMDELARQRGAAAYIAKPFRGTALLDVVRSVIAADETA